MKEYKFSIIVPVYNIEEYINKCIDSIVKQNYTNYEVIIVNDGSTDNSLSKLKKYNQDNIKIVTKKNGGLSSARNFGLKYATGEYVWFVDGDDYIEKKSLYELNKKLNSLKYEPELLVFQYFEDYQTKRVRFIDRISWNDKEYLPLVAVSAWSKIYKMNYIKKEKIKFTEGLIYEDLEINPYLLCTAKHVEFLEKPLYNYVIRDGSIMNEKKFKQNRDDKFIVLKRLFNRFKENNIYEQYHEQLTYLAIRHLIMVYSREIMIFDKSIYIPRCNRVLDFLNQMDNNWINNKYLKESSKLSRLFAKLYKAKMFTICKIVIKFWGVIHENK